MPAPVAIVDRKLFSEYLDLATRRTKEIAAEVPDWQVADMVLPQLDFMRASTTAGRAATGEELERLNVGVVAMRNVEEVDPDLARVLVELDFAYRRFEALP